MTRVRGSCLCGNYRFAIEGPIHFLKNCHCSQCRKMSGSTFATYARASSKDLRVLSGGDALGTYERRPGNAIAFCQRCGSLVPYPPPGSSLLEFAAGLLDDDPGVDVAYHIFAGSRAPWCEIEDGLLRFDELGGLSESERMTLPRVRRKSEAQKPRYLGPEYGAQFGDASVVRAYGARPPYPEELFTQLAALLPKGARCVLELGCGSGDLSFGLRPQVAQLDAIDPSSAMLAVARERGQNAAQISFIQSSAEAFVPHKLYDLAVAAESLHWMDWERVLGKLARCLRPEAVLAIVTRRVLRGLPWQGALEPLIARYSTNREYKAYDLVHELRERDLFRELGRRTFRAPFTQSVEDYVESFHSRNGFSRERMPVREAAAFDDAVKALVLAHRADGVIASEVEATLVWGSPAHPERA
jgi:ubiquinone/menaquinone biosynthesis C-methylase UbiE